MNIEVRLPNSINNQNPSKSLNPHYGEVKIGGPSGWTYDIKNFQGKGRTITIFTMSQTTPRINTSVLISSDLSVGEIKEKIKNKIIEELPTKAVKFLIIDNNEDDVGGSRQKTMEHIGRQFD